MLNTRLYVEFVCVQHTTVYASLLLDPSTCVEVPQAPKNTNDELQKKVEEFVNSKLGVTADKARQIEVNTREQSRSPMWYDACRLRLTASLFGRVR